MIEIPAFEVNKGAAMIDRLPTKAVDSENVLTMEDIDQTVGFINYRKEFPNGIKGDLNVGQPRDYVVVMVNGKVVGERLAGAGGPGAGRGGGAARGPTSRGAGAPGVAGPATRGAGPATRGAAGGLAGGPGRGAAPAGQPISIDVSGPATLDIIVHNLGRTSLTRSVNGERKGLSTNPTLSGTALTGWKIYSMPLDDPAQLPASTKGSLSTGPTFYEGTFNVSATGETYLDMSNFHFGVVWVNGHNLGRYWEVGSTRALYLPSPWQKQGENKITVLELGPAPTTTKIAGVTKMVETPGTALRTLWTPPSTQPAAN
jgi:hypothetical protein